MALETGERWRPVVGYEAYYEVSSLGRVRRSGRGDGAVIGRILRSRLDKKSGYLRVNLSRDGIAKTALISRLVCQAFYDKPDNCDADPKETRHLDGDRLNNRSDNLAWGTRLDNERDKALHGTLNRGGRNGSAKLSTESVLQIRASSRSRAALARDYGVSWSLIDAIKKGAVWAWLSGAEGEGA